MPTYEYVCDQCGHRLEALQSMSEAPLRKCPACSKLKLRRLISAGAGFIFKGSGFYITDYRSDSYKQSADKDSSAPTTADSADSTKADAAAPAKPAESTAEKAPAKAANKGKGATGSGKASGPAKGARKSRGKS